MAKAKQTTKKKPPTGKKKGAAPGAPAPDSQASASPPPPHQEHQAASGPGPGHNGDDSDQQALFVNHFGAYERAKRAMETAATGMREVKAKLKAEGFTVKQMDVAFLLSNDEDGTAEKKIRDRIARELQAAKWMGTALGTQFSMFGEPDRTPAVDRAFDEGKLAGMRGEVRKPPYDSSVPQYGRWIDGWHVGQEALMRKPGGIGSGANGAAAAPAPEPAADAQPPQENGDAAASEPDLRPPHLRMREADRAAEAAVQNATAPGRDAADEFPDETV